MFQNLPKHIHEHPASQARNANIKESALDLEVQVPDCY